LPGVIVKEGESIESALRRFRTVCRDARVQEDFKRAQRYEKPSEKRRRKIQESQRRRARKARKHYD
jgi:small subunit ribosomal protein S21